MIFALLPISFLYKVQRLLQKRISIGVLLSLGLFASVASIMKAIAADSFGETDDPNAEGITMGAWTLIEEQVAVIAACVPCMRAVFQSFMVKVGVAKTKGTHHQGSRSSGKQWVPWHWQGEYIFGPTAQDGDKRGDSAGQYEGVGKSG
ncbi:hypothetical protein V8F33_009523 [Rhypophila sp. PSN 637]